MAKKNSTKTATKEALQNSEPKLQAFRQWKGINFSEVSPLWNDYVQEVFTDDRQTDLPPNYLLVQNNLKTTNQAAVETVFKPVKWIDGPSIHGSSTYTDGIHNLTISGFSGVNYIDHEYGYFAASTAQGDAIFALDRKAIDITTNQYDQPITYLPNFMNWEDSGIFTVTNQRVTDMRVYLNRMIVMVEKDITETNDGVTTTYQKGGIYATVDDDNHNFPIHPLLPGYELLPQTDASEAPVITCFGNIKGSTDPNDPILIPEGGTDPLWSSRCTFYYCLTNQWGSTQSSMWDSGDGYITYYFNDGPDQWTTTNYIKLSGIINNTNMDRARIGETQTYQPVGVDLYLIKDEATYPIFVGHADATLGLDEQSQVIGLWNYDYYGAMTDTSEWNQGSMIVSDENTTGGVPCRYVTQIDGRLYFWGDEQHPYRFYIGGNAGHELSVAIGHGGAYCDIEPGAGVEVKMIEKFKTYGGSSIVTILCSNVNGTRQKRYNLIETNIIATSELSTASYMVEEIANVVGTTSRHGGGAWSDGLYYINRNGLLVTTQQMEYSSQLRSMLVSEPVTPVFEEQKGTEIANAYVVCIKDIIYMATCTDVDNYSQIDHNVSHYNSFIWCYDIGLKAWYTMQPCIGLLTTDATNQTTLIPNGLFCYDHEDSVHYGLGVVDSQYGVWVCPLLSNQETNEETFNAMQEVHLETGELGTSNPNIQWQWLCQLEFNFDYFAGDMEIEVNGVDYYGRRMHIVKKVSSPVTDQVTPKPVMLTAFNVPIRIDTLVRYYHIRINGTCMFRLNNIVARTYTQSKKIGMVYGFDAEHYYMDRFNSEKKRYMHDAVSCYNNLDKLAYKYRVRDDTAQTPILDQETATVT